MVERVRPKYDSFLQSRAQKNVLDRAGLKQDIFRMFEFWISEQLAWKNLKIASRKMQTHPPN